MPSSFKTKQATGTKGTALRKSKCLFTQILSLHPLQAGALTMYVEGSQPPAPSREANNIIDKDSNLVEN